MGLVGGAARAVGLVDLVTGADRDFGGGVGHWVAAGAGATVVYDGTVGLNGKGSAKFHSTTPATSQYIEVPISGTFKSGKLYHALVILKQAALSTTNYDSYLVTLGLQGTDIGFQAELIFGGPDASITSFSPSGVVVALITGWTPGADRTGVTLRISRNVAGTVALATDLSLLQARVVLVPDDSPGLAVPVGAALSTLDGNTVPSVAMVPTSYLGAAGIGVRDRAGQGGVVGFLLNARRVQMLAGADALENGSFVSMGSTFGVYAYANGDIGRRINSGWDFEVGPDYDGFYFNERSSSEVEFVPDGDVDVILVDGGHNADTSHQWYTENADGTLKSALSKLHNILVGTADPTAGGGVTHPQPAMYLRNNGGTTEIWTTTGAGATAWQKVTIP